MARNQTVKGTVHNIFALNRVRKECYYEPIRVDFSAIEKPNNQAEDIVPFFNKDRQYFTPSFIIQRQKTTLEQNGIIQKNKFQMRISHSEYSSQESTPQYRPTDSKDCQLCQQCFSDYWQHINGKYHKRMINSRLCKSFQLQAKPTNPPKSKKIHKPSLGKKATKGKHLVVQESIPSCLLAAQVIQGYESHPTIPTEQSLKITLQLGNCSTNMLSDNTFKQLFQDG